VPHRKLFEELLRRLKQAGIVDVTWPGPALTSEDNPDRPNESCAQIFGPLTK
jgi:methylmalonyl-CoA mutase cobalamin-binding subunit